MSDVAGLQNEDGSFSGDMWGEVDTRYPSPTFLSFLHFMLCLSYYFYNLEYVLLNPILCFPFRFSYIAVCCLSLIHRLDKINVEKAVNYIVSCKNLDGGFGCTPGGESHAGQSMICMYHIVSLRFCFWIFLCKLCIVLSTSALFVLILWQQKSI